MKTRMRWAVVVLVVLVAAVGVWRLGRTMRERASFEALRDSVQVLRLVATECAAELDGGEGALQRYRDRLDSLRSDVRDYEAQDPRGVPAAQYEEYLAEFTRYRDSAAAWDVRVAALQRKLGECRDAAFRHNTAMDSLRARYGRMK